MVAGPKAQERRRLQNPEKTRTAGRVRMVACGAFVARRAREVVDNPVDLTHAQSILESESIQPSPCGLVRVADLQKKILTTQADLGAATTGSSLK